MEARDLGLVRISDPAGTKRKAVTSAVLPEPRLTTPARNGRLALGTTPARLQISLGLTWLATLMYFLILASGVAELRGAAQAIGYDAAPAIVAALHGRSDMAGIDADVANYLVAPGDRNIQADQDLQRDLQSAFDRMQTLATTRLGESEERSLKAMYGAIGIYLQDWGQARELHRLGGKDPQALVVYRDATYLMRETTFPSAERLVASSLDRLLAEYQGQFNRRGSLVIGGILVSVLLLAVLIGLQCFLASTYRRRFSPPLLAATIVTLGFTGFSLWMFPRQANELLAARQAFDSVYGLWSARALASDTSADQSRLLFDREWADRYQSAFDTKTALIARGLNDESLSVEALRELSQSPGAAKFKGYLSQAIPQSGPSEATTGLLNAYTQYIALDGEMRALERSGEHDAAVRLKIRTDAGQVGWAVGQLDQAFEQSIRASQGAFDTAIQRGLAYTEGYEYKAAAVALLVGFFNWLGIRPRLREYGA